MELPTLAADLTRPVKVLFASASEAVIQRTLEEFRSIFPDLPLVVVSEFKPAEGEWIPFHILRSWRENYGLVKARLGGRSIRIAAVILEPRTPHWRLRALGFALAPIRFLAFNENGNHFMLRPRSVPAIVRHLTWRSKNLVRSQRQPGSWTYAVTQWMKHPVKFRLSLLYRRAMARGRWLARARPIAMDQPVQKDERLRGISVVIPSRSGRELLERCLPGIQDANEIIVVDNGSHDDTSDFLRREFPRVLIDQSAEALVFATAVNRGIRRTSYSHVCLLNNDMVVEPGFLSELLDAFARVPELFSATAQIFLPEGARREETGKTVLNPAPGVMDLPVRCDIPLEGEDQSYVLYGSGGCTLYDAAKLKALGCFDETYRPAYVEDLDLGVRAWLRGWPSVYCAQARVLHAHRTTTSRYFSSEELETALEVNYLHFLARTIGDRELFTRLWQHDVLRLKALEKQAPLLAAAREPAAPVPSGDIRFLDLVNGEVAVFPSRRASGKPVVLVASPYLPFPLSHGAAVRIYNLMRGAAPDFDQVLVAFVEESAPVPRELLDLCVEVVTVRRSGSHALPSRGRPDTVEEFDRPAFHAALRQTIAKWRPGIVQLEFTQMAQYATASRTARTVLVEHDITYDLYAQMLERSDKNDWEIRRQHERWVEFETTAWRQVDRVVTMSEKDRGVVALEGAVSIPNGVDLDRFRPSPTSPEARRLLFIGSFAHRPNVLALEFFLRDVFPHLRDVTLHVIAGQRHQRFWDLQHPGVEVEGFVSDVRPAYQRATLVIAPLVASAGTNVKILEAMAMGKVVVSTEAGIHGLDVRADVVVANSAEEMSYAITQLLESPDRRSALEQQARSTVERLYGWDAIATVQKKLYEGLL
jgi:GT2 family glycosyltransferase/glycosyltransferase involved in cell wall biosynthesis